MVKKVPKQGEIRMKKSQAPKQSNVLSAAELCNWKIAHLELQLENEKLRSERLRQELAELRFTLAKNSAINAASTKANAALRNYDKIVSELSVDIKGKLVNDLTGEVTEDEI